MKKIIIAAIVYSCFLYGCNGNNSNGSTSSSDTTSAMANDTLGKMADTSKSMDTSLIDQKSKSFIAEAATGGLMEVELGQMAEQMSSNQHVKDFGKMMVDDHTQLNNNLKSVAAAKKIELPASITDDQKKEIDALSKKTGKEFDKAYVDMMIDDHKNDIAAFKKAQQDAEDNDIKNFITNSLPVLQKHLDSIKAVKSKM